jgi:hypothetical protein
MDLFPLGTWMKQHHGYMALILALSLALAAGCSPVPGSGGQPTGLVPGPGEVKGWEPLEKARTYNRDDVFDYMDGESELYFTYGFQEVTVQRYKPPRGTNAVVELYRTGSDADAYGLFTFYSMGNPVSLGAGGAAQPGQVIVFWQGRYFVRVFADKGTTEEAALLSLAQAVSNKLPEGGQPPALVTKLPAEGLRATSVKFFHHKMALDNILFLSGDNTLNLSDSTNGVVAEYQRAGQKLVLLIIEYPVQAEAGEGLASLKKEAPDAAAAAGQRGPYLAAAFDTADQDLAAKLVDEALIAANK